MQNGELPYPVIVQNKIVLKQAWKSLKLLQLRDDAIATAGILFAHASHSPHRQSRNGVYKRNRMFLPSKVQSSMLPRR